MTTSHCTLCKARLFLENSRELGKCNTCRRQEPYMQQREDDMEADWYYVRPQFWKDSPQSPQTT